MSDTVADLDPTAAEEPPAADDPVATSSDVGGDTSGWRAWRDRLVARAKAEPALVVLVGAIVVWLWVFVRLVWDRHRYFGTFDFDLGHHDQGIWLLSRGQGFITVSGMPLFGHHFTLAYVLLVPFYWLGAGPQFLNVVQNLALAVSAVPIYLYARDKLSSAWLACGLGVAWLLNPSMQWLAQETWHPETVAIPFLLFAFLMVTRQRWRPYWILLVLAMAWKEDLSLAVAMFGVGLVFTGKRREGFLTILVAAAWFVLAYQLVMPHFNGGLNHAGTFYGEIGESPTDILRTALTDPKLIHDRLEGNDALGYARDLLSPYGFAPLLSPLMLLVAAPQFFANILTNQSFFYDVRFHYVAVILVAFAFGMVQAAARFQRPGAQRFVVGAVLACALATTATRGPSPLGDDYATGIWPLHGNARQAVIEASLGEVPGDASVSANYYLVPHLTHREQAYTFPNPWLEHNWGVRYTNDEGESVVEAPEDPRHDHTPDEVDWLVVDRTVLGPGSREMILLDTLLANGEFRVVSDEAGIVVARRVEPPTQDPPAEVVAQTPPTSTTLAP